MFKALKKRWNVTSNIQLALIFIVFSITGSVSAWISKPFVELFGLNNEVLPEWILWPLRLILIFPVYSLILLVIGTLFGQFKFFWAFEKRMFSRFIPKKKMTEN